MNRVWWSLFLGLTVLMAACGGDEPEAATGAESVSANTRSATQPATTTEPVPRVTTSAATSAPDTTDAPVTPTTEVALEVASDLGDDRRSVLSAVQLFFEAAAVGNWDIAGTVYGDGSNAQVARSACGVGCRPLIAVVELYTNGPAPPLPFLPTDLSVEIQTSAGVGLVIVSRSDNPRQWFVSGELPSVALGEASPSELVQLAELLSPSALVITWPGSVQRIDADGQRWVTTDARAHFGFLNDEWITTGSDFLSTSDLSVICADPEGGLRARELVRFDGRLIGRFAEAEGSSGVSVDIDCETGEVIDRLEVAFLDPFESIEQMRNGVVVRDQRYFEHERTIERADGTLITEDLISGGWRLSPDGLTVAYVGACSGNRCSLVIRRVADGVELGRWEFPYHRGISGFDGRWALMSDFDDVSLVDTTDGTVRTFSVSADVRLIPTE